MSARSRLEWSEGAAGPVLTALVSDEVQDWRDLAACAEVGDDFWFPEKGGSTREAKKVCQGCPVQAECLEYALENNEQFGIYGGLSARERQRMKREAA